ncbi:hypothetical protein EJB05_37663, partial [Eragrostis curvula]
MEKSTVVPPKRDHKSEDQLEVEGEADAAKKRKIEPRSEETEYQLEWDDSWWSAVEPGDDDDIELHTDVYAWQARLFRESPYVVLRHTCWNLGVDVLGQALRLFASRHSHIVMDEELPSQMLMPDQPARSTLTTWSSSSRSSKGIWLMSSLAKTPSLNM